MSPEQHERAVEIFETKAGVEYSDDVERSREWGDAVAEAIEEPTSSFPDDHSFAGIAWSDAHAFAAGAGVSDPGAFALAYTGMIEDAQYEIRNPDGPLPTPAEFIWP